MKKNCFWDFLTFKKSGVVICLELKTGLEKSGKDKSEIEGQDLKSQELKKSGNDNEKYEIENGKSGIENTSVRIF